MVYFFYDKQQQKQPNARHDSRGRIQDNPPGFDQGFNSKCSLFWRSISFVLHKQEHSLS
jgi:hypothetical protein